MNITPEQIGEFLKLNPDFFSSHPQLLAEITVPNPYSGQAISLGERQVMALRDKSRGLEIKLREFIQFAEENDAIGDKLHKLALSLMRAKTLNAALQSFYLSLSDSFAVPHTAVRMWGPGAPDLPEFSTVSVDIQALAEGMSQPMCGAEVPAEVRGWFGEIGAHQKSFALAPLRDGQLTGLMVLASEDAKRFYPEMGTLYLSWLAELAGAACARFV